MQSKVLSGWKDIANYLGKGVRTVQRYERELGLPVRRPSGKPKGSVIATRTELDAWVACCRLTNHPIPRASPLAVYTSLRDRIAEMGELAERMKNLRFQIHTSREMLCATVQRIHEDTRHEFGKIRRSGGEKIAIKRAV